MSTHIFEKKDPEYNILIETKEWRTWGLVTHYDRIGIFHKCINETWTKKVNRITHMYLRAPSNFTCSYCQGTPPEEVYALWALYTWDDDIWDLTDKYSRHLYP